MRTNKGLFRIFAVAITAVMCTLIILSAVFPFPEGTGDFLSIGTGRSLLAQEPEIGEIADMRDRTTKVYYEGNGLYSADYSIGSVHYQDESGDWRDIDTTIEVSNRPNWDWEVNKGHWTLLIAEDTTVAVGKEGNWLGFKYRGYGYLDWSTKEYVVLGTPNSVTPIVSEHSITWNNLFGGVNLEYVYTADGFKENLYVSQAARDWLVANPPSSYGLNNPTTYLVGGLECDWQSAYTAEDIFGVAINWSNVNEFIDSGVFWRDPATQKIVSALPIGYARHDEVVAENWTKLRYRFYEDAGTHYLLFGARVLDLNAYPSGTINLDPSVDEQVGASADDADETEATGAMSVTGTVVAYDSSTSSASRRWGGHRWTSGSFPPQGSDITVANVSLYFYSSGFDDVNVNWHFEEDEAPAAFTTTPNDITDRDRTETSTSDIEDGVGTGWQMICGGNTTALVPPLQEVLDAYSPVSIVLISRPNQDATKYLRSSAYDLSSSWGAQLHIEWTEEAEPEWLSGWDNRCSITIDAGDVGSNLTWFPVTLHLGTSVGINNDDVSFIFDELGDNGKKIAVTDVTGNELFVEIETWNTTTEQAVLWVSNATWVVDSSTNTTLYLYYDADHADNSDHVADSGSRPEVWDDYYCAVFHMAEDPSGSAPQIINSVASKAVPIVATMVNEWLLGGPYNRNIWYANGRWWLFYVITDEAVYYRSATSIEDLPYATATQVTTNVTGGYACDFVVSSTTLQYVSREASTENLYYRQGTLESNGTITWDAAEQTIDVSAYGISPIQDICITADSSGYAWVSWAHTTSSSPKKGKVWVIKNENNNGTWSTDANVGVKQIGPEYTSTPSIPCWPTLVPLTSGKMYALAHSDGTDGGEYYATGDLWNGSAWLGSQEQATLHYTYGASTSAVAVDDDVHLTYGAYDPGYGDYSSTYYRKRTYGTGWGSETEIKTTSPSQACLGKDSSGDLYCFWMNGTYGQTPALTDIYYRKCTNGSWGSVVNWHTTRESISRCGILTCSYAEQNSSLVLAYITGDEYSGERMGKLWLADVLSSSLLNAPYATSGGSMISGDLVDGKIGKALYFDGSNDYLYAQDSPDMGDADFTLEAWASRASHTTADYLLWKCIAGYKRAYMCWFYEVDDKMYAQIEENYPTIGTSQFHGDEVTQDATWKCWAVSFDRSGNGQVHLNGATDGSPTSISANDDTLDTDAYFFIGAAGLDKTLPPSAGNWFHGKLDEVRLSRILRDSDWLSTTYQSSIDNFVDWGSAESSEVQITNTPSSNAFGVLAVNTTSNTAINYFQIENTGNCTVDVVIYGTDATGGDDTWTLSDTATPGENIYGLYAGLDDDDDEFDVIVRKTETYNTLIEDLAEDATQDWGLKLYMPTSLSGYDCNNMTATITLVASESS